MSWIGNGDYLSLLPEGEIGVNRKIMIAYRESSVCDRQEFVRLSSACQYTELRVSANSISSSHSEYRYRAVAINVSAAKSVIFEMLL